MEAMCIRSAYFLPWKNSFHRNGVYRKCLQRDFCGIIELTVHPRRTSVDHPTVANCNVRLSRIAANAIPTGDEVSTSTSSSTNFNAFSSNSSKLKSCKRTTWLDRVRHYSSYSTAADSPTSTAWQIGRYGGNDTLHLVERQTPTIARPNEVLIKVHAASINPIDIRTRGGYGASLLNKARRSNAGDEFPLTLGRDCSGVVVGVGKAVKDLAVGDGVWGSVNAARQGCHAEYVVAGADELSRKPEGLAHVEAASMPYAAITNWSAAYAVAKFRPANALGKRALILGGSGGVGTLGLQLLHAWGANVTVTCSEDAFDLVYGLGAHHAVDYGSPDVVGELLARGKYDFILNAAYEDLEGLAVQVIREKAYAQYVTLVTPFMEEMDRRGAFVGGLASSLTLFRKSRKFAALGAKYRWAFAQPNGPALKEVAKLVQDGKIRPVVDKVFTYDDLPSAFSRVERGHGRGKVVVDMAGVEEKQIDSSLPQLFG